MRTFYVDNQKHKELFNLYSVTVKDILQKNIDYNNEINNVLDQYVAKYSEYINNPHTESYPTNFLVQLVTNIILINDNKYKKSIIDLYGNDNLNKYFSFKTRVLNIEVELNEDTLTKDDKDNLNLELIDINDKILEFEQSEKMMLEENA